MALGPNPHRVPVLEALRDHGFSSVENFLAHGGSHDSIVPACCKHGCQVEPDGRCQHGCPSVLLALGYM